MQCPRCGADNPPDVTACVRCGLPAYTQAPPRPTPPPNPASSGWGTYRQTQTMHLERYDLDAYERPTVVLSAMVCSGIGALLALVYGVYALTFRRGIFADIADGASVSSDDASRSDLVNAIGLWAAVAVAVLALALWLVSFIVERHGRTLLGQVAFAVTLLGAAGVLYGGLSIAAVDTADAADDAATGYLFMGPGFLVVAAGLVLALLSLRHRSGADPLATPPYGGNAQYSAMPPPGYGPPPPGPGYPAQQPPPPGQQPPPQTPGQGW